MRNEKINLSMTTMEVVKVMSEGNPGAMRIVMMMLSDLNGFMNLLDCDHLNIRGSRLYMLYNDCCGCNMDKFNRTIALLKFGVFSVEELNNNLDLSRAISFIDGIPGYDEDFGPNHPLWNEYCSMIRASFAERLEHSIENQKKFGRF